MKNVLNKLCEVNVMKGAAMFDAALMGATANLNAAQGAAIDMAERRSQLAATPMPMRDVFARENSLNLSQAHNNTMSKIYEANQAALEKAADKKPRGVNYVA